MKKPSSLLACGTPSPAARLLRANRPASPALTTLVVVVAISGGLPMSALAQSERPRVVGTFTIKDKGTGPVLFSPDGGTLAIATGDSLVLWEVASQQVRAKFEVPLGLIPLGSVAFTSDGKGLAATTGDTSRLWFWDLPTGKPRVLPVRMRTDTKGIKFIALSPVGKTLAWSDGTGAVELWDPAAIEKQGTLDAKDRIIRLAFSHDGRMLAAIGATDGVPPVGRAWVWDVAEQRLRTTFKLEISPMGLAFSPDGQTLAVGQADTIQLLDPASGRLRVSWKFGASVVALAFSPDGRILIAGGGERDEPGLVKGSGEVKFWDVTLKKEILSFRAHEDEILRMALSPDGKLLAVSTGAPSLPMNLWDVSAITGKKPVGQEGK